MYNRLSITQLAKVSQKHVAVSISSNILQYGS